MCIYNSIFVTLLVTLNIESDDEILYSSLGSGLLPIGCLIGSIMFTILNNHLGRKNTIIICHFLTILGNIFTCISLLWLMFVGRFLSGLAVGGFIVLIPCYIVEYVPIKYEGKCGTINFLSLSIGVIVCFLLAIPLPFERNLVDVSNKYWIFVTLFPCITSFIAILLLIFWFKIDTPYMCYLVDSSLEKLNKSLEYIYDNNEERLKIMNLFKLMKMENQESSYCKLICNNMYKIRFVVGLVINCGQQLTGTLVFTYYSSSIFFTLEPKMNIMLFSSLFAIGELVGNFICLFLIQILGRKIILLVGIIGVFLNLLAMTILFYLETGNSSHKFIVISYYIFLGLTDPLLYVLNSDLLPDSIAGIVTSANWIILIIVIFLFPTLSQPKSLGLNGVFLIFTVCTFLYFTFVLIFYKDTTNKTVKEINEIYSEWF